MKTCASKIRNHNRRYQRLQCPPLFPLASPPSSHQQLEPRLQQQQQQQNSKSRTMSFNGTLKVFVNGAWITWIYLFAIFIQLEYVDAKIGKRPTQFHMKNINVNELIFSHSHFPRSH